jgi:peptidoglycan/xylan/chitin deacetylase (PgdA/CDA1 family)
MSRGSIVALMCLTSVLAAATPVRASACNNPNALGTSRVLTVEPGDFPRLGTMQYSATLPLADKEVVLTFDDGPLPPYSTRVLDILKAECVKATYFMVGRMARNFPDLVRRTASEGHTIGTHSETHPLTFDRMLPERIEQEVSSGIASTAAALGDGKPLAPFFRIPGLLRAPPVENYLAANGLMVWSADFPADDWKRIGSHEVLQRALARIEAKRKGVLLLHDIQPATVLALPALLRELKTRGYRIVHVVPAEGERRPLDPPMLVAGRKAWPDAATSGAASPPARARLSWPRVLPDSEHVKLAMAGGELLAAEDPAYRKEGSLFLDVAADSSITGWPPTSALDSPSDLSPDGWQTSTLIPRLTPPTPPKRKMARKPPAPAGDRVSPKRGSAATALPMASDTGSPRASSSRIQTRQAFVQPPVIEPQPQRGRGLLSILFGQN